MSLTENSEKTGGKLIKNNSEHCDCVLIVEDEKILAHKYILACFSPVFKSMFYGAMACEEVEIPDIGCEEFKQMLQFVYTDELEIKSIINAWSLVYIASKYLIDNLLNACIKYIDDNMGISHLLLIYEYAEHYNQEKLKKKCWKNITHYTNSVFDCDYHIKPSTWHTLLDEDSLNIDEVDLIQQVSVWAKEECTVRNIDGSIENIWKILDEHEITERLRFINIEPSCYSILTNLFSEKDLVLISKLQKERGKKLKHLLMKLLTEDLKRNVKILSVNRQRKFLTSFYEVREWVKIYKNFRLSNSDMLTTVVSVNRKIVLFGVAVSTEHEPCNAPSKTYTGSYTIELFKDKGSKLVVIDKICAPFSVLKYDSVSCIDFPNGIVLDAGVNYIVGIRYNRSNEHTRSEVLCHYLGNIERDSITFTFSNEFSGSALRGFAFYPF